MLLILELLHSLVEVLREFFFLSFQLFFISALVLVALFSQILDSFVEEVSLLLAKGQLTSVLDLLGQEFVVHFLKLLLYTAQFVLEIFLVLSTFL